MKQTAIYSVLLIAFTGLLLTCEIDHGLRPQQYLIKGNVIFLRGQPPDNTDRIEVYAIKEFPPQDPQNMLYLGQSGALDFSNGNTIPYQIPVSPTTYEAIVLIWKEKGYSINLTGLIGIYTTQENYPLPVPVTVSQQQPVAEGIDIYSDWTKVSKDASISGTITYKGEWPADTQILLLAIYRIKPSNATSLLFFENVDYTQPLNVESSTYRLLVSKGTYQYIVLYWVGKSISGLEDLVPIGIYENQDQPGSAGIVKVDSGEHVTGIDIHIDFSQLTFPTEKQLPEQSWHNHP